MKRKLTDIADIQIGYQFRKKLEPVENGTYRVIQIRDFNENLGLRSESLLRVQIDKPAEQYLINKGDVIFLSRGHKNWAASIADELKDTIAVSHFFVLKIKHESVFPEYLAWYINQTPAQEYLRSTARHGTHMPLVPLSSFKELAVDVPDMETQRKIIALSGLMEKEQLLLNKLQERRSLLINAACLNASKSNKEIIK